MEEGESILGAIYEEDDLEDVGDVEMLDMEEGEFVEHDAQTDLGQSNGGDVNAGTQVSQSKNQRRRGNKKKNKKKRSGSGPKVMDINRFVLESCKRLKERKSYMVYTAVGCLGVSALSDLLKEVDAIQACGGQMTADGSRLRRGGGILWGIIKTREPAAYREIMKKAKEFEKQFRPQNIRQVPEQNKEGSSQRSASALPDGLHANVSDGSQLIPQNQNQNEHSSTEGKRKSVHDRIRVPVSYDDLLSVDPTNDSI